MANDKDEVRDCWNRLVSQVHPDDVYSPEEHSYFRPIRDFIATHELHDKRCLDVGCGFGIFQDMVDDYTGVDISDSVQPYIRKPFHRCNATQLPFADDTFDAVWTMNMLEHVPGPERALEEMRRVLKPDGLLFLAAAWQCRPWLAEGYPIRPYRDFDFKGKLIKASIPIRNSVLFRSLLIIPGRVATLVEWSMFQHPLTLKYKKLRPNYEHVWTVDSDAVNSMDPYQAILWFVSRGDECLSHHNWLSQFFVRSGRLVFRVKRDARGEHPSGGG